MLPPNIAILGMKDKSVAATMTAFKIGNACTERFFHPVAMFCRGFQYHFERAGLGSR